MAGKTNGGFMKRFRKDEGRVGTLEKEMKGKAFFFE